MVLRKLVLPPLPATIITAHHLFYSIVSMTRDEIAMRTQQVDISCFGMARDKYFCEKICYLHARYSDSLLRNVQIILIS